MATTKKTSTSTGASKKSAGASASKKSGAAKKSGATKKGAAAAKKSGGGLSVIEGGKGKAKRDPNAVPLLGDGKTPANPEAMRRALSTYGVEVPEGATPAELLTLLRKAMTSKLKGLPEIEMVKCDAVCKEVSTQDTDFCPFCGDEGLEEDPALAGAEDVLPEEPVEEPTRSTASGLQVAVGRLDESVERINQLRADLAGNSYDLGVELRKIHEEELWKARGHDSFKDFIQKELDISRAMAYRLIDITKQFDRETFEKVGSRKLALIAGIQDADAREAALESAKAGASTRDVEREVNEAKGRKSAPEKERASSEVPKKKTGNEITLLAKVGSRPQLVGFRSASSGRPIQAHKDDAYAEFNLSEDVKQRIALKKDKEGNIVGVTIAFVRVE